MKIIVSGAGGHMGQVLTKMIEDTEGTEVCALIDAVAGGEGSPYLADINEYDGEADMIIDFSHHSATETLLNYAKARKLAIVVATTGQTEEERAMIFDAKAEIPVFFSGNMSMGIAMLAQLVRDAVKLFPDADVEIVEAHHNRKLDVPSGTALLLADAVKEARPEAEYLIGRHENGKRTKNEVGIHSLRMGNTVGIHEVIINTGTQILSLKHEAQDRSLFAEGAIRAAQYIIDKPAGMYNLGDIIKEATC